MSATNPHTYTSSQRPLPTALLTTRKYGPASSKRAVEFVAVLLQDVRHRVEFGERGRELFGVVGDQSGDLFGEVLGPDEQVVDGLAPMVELGEQQVAVLDETVEFVARVGEGVGDGVRVGEQVGEFLVAGGDGP